MTGEKIYEELLNKNEEVISTHHKKIMISRVNNSGISNIINNIEDLVELATQNKNMPVVKQMKMIVREFISKNSIYEKLDVEQQLAAVQAGVEN